MKTDQYITGWVDEFLRQDIFQKACDEMVHRLLIDPRKMKNSLEAICLLINYVEFVLRDRKMSIECKTLLIKYPGEISHVTNGFVPIEGRLAVCYCRAGRDGLVKETVPSNVAYNANPGLHIVDPKALSALIGIPEHLLNKDAHDQNISACPESIDAEIKELIDGIWEHVPPSIRSQYADNDLLATLMYASDHLSKY